MTADYALWNAIVSTVTLLVVGTAAIAAFRQLRHLRAQTSLAGFLKILSDWRDPEFQKLIRYVRDELPRRVQEPGFLDDLDRAPVDRAKHPELEVCDWYEQLGSYIKYGLIDEEVMLDVSASSTNAAWAALEPVIRRMRRTRSEALYENFEYYVARGVLFQRAHPRLLSEEHTAHGAARQRAQVRPSDRGGGRAEREAGFARPPQARRVLFVTRLRRGSRGSPGGARSRAPCACRGTARCEREIRICFAGG